MLQKILNYVKRYYKKALISALILVLLVIVAYGYTAVKALIIVKNIKKEVVLAKNTATVQDFNSLRQAVKEIEQNTAKLKNEVGEMDLVKAIIAGDELRAVERILNNTSLVLSSSQKLIDITEEMHQDLGLQGKTFQDLNLNKLTGDQKGNILVAVRQATPVLQEINQKIGEIEPDVNFLLNSPWAKYLNDEKLAELKKITSLRKMIDFMSLSLDYFPQILGYYDQANYLFLLENNTEMRSTGGFLGTYGLLQAKDGRSQKLIIDDVYNLDKKVKETLFVTPPWQLTKWNDTAQWFLRDANWSPDFPTSAKQAEWFYNQESGENLEFTGVMALTPQIVADIIGLVDGIEVHNIKFTKENFVEMLEYRVEQEFRDLGIPLSERKKIITDLSSELQKKVKKLPLDKKLELFAIVQENLDKKHILLFFNDQKLQKIVQDKGWAGEVRQADSDYLMAIDANLGSLKTDAVMQKGINYQVQEKDGALIAKVVLDYYNDGKFTWHSTRYRTYTRIYTPLGSELISAEGMMADERTTKVGEVKTEEELGKTVFGAFISIEPKERKTLTFEYKLSNYIYQQFKTGGYKLLIQKQAGTAGHKLKVDLAGQVWEGKLGVDREFKN